MPDGPNTLDHRLGEARSELLSEILIPDLAQVRVRAGRIRQRRTRLTAGASALALALVVGLVGVVARQWGPDAAPQPAASQGSTGAVWRGGGLTLLGLDGPVLDQPGDLTDVQFADPDRGYALTGECDRGSATCSFALAASTDGGRTWTDRPLPFEQASASQPPRLLAVGDALVVHTDAAAWFAESGLAVWRQVPLDDPLANVATIPSGARVSVEPDDCGASLIVWRPDGTAARLANAPAMIVCSVAPVAASDGAWWIGGRTANGAAPAVGVSRDRGATWAITALPAGDGVAQVSTNGNRVLASVVLPRGGNPYPETMTVSGVFRSVDSGPFTPYRTQPGTLIGDLVPLLDGRLVAAGPDWQISAAAGDEPWAPAGGSLPWVYRIARTTGMWVAYDLFKEGWAAVSRDGETWQKINVR